ncbi:hypothetical protein QNI16_24140 [Cytophagaceae bacterium YF14B1]|uniref:Uncharacterized protein n=1 Tax=Xanthocytophaga flava TaxID=3048013 RepID=A0AAE3QUN1_9BACT|nr:hypothetical protein [Xanthocytophaga flavus]MDJ1483611.1 hypothetical protein [Xanthocytophaga flavus]
MKTKLYIFCFLMFSACNSIETNDTLSKSDIDYIRSLNLLDKDEQIHRFYSEYKKRVAGNFFTDKRMAKYWIDERDSKKNSIHSAFYNEIQAIDTVYYAGATYSPYMMITKTDGKQFKVCADGKREEIKAFFEEAIHLWRQKKAAN